MSKYSLAGDPRGLIYEAYRIEGITSEECRAIFFDWVLGLKPELDPIMEITKIYYVYGPGNPGHPMNQVFEEGLSNYSNKPKRRRRHPQNV